VKPRKAARQRAVESLLRLGEGERPSNKLLDSVCAEGICWRNALVGRVGVVGEPIKGI
jgi:hypothetical protein